MPDAVSALESDSTVRVSRDQWIVFEPITREAARGFIFYPGGRVSPEAYAPLGRALADNGYLAVIVPMPLNFAILDPDAAAGVIAAYPSVRHWAIGGHSLGGVMAARFAHGHSELVDGLALLAAYPEAHIDLSDSGLAVATIYGDRDGLVTVEEVRRSLDRLPADADVVLIEGGNHAQFGFYGAQTGDGAALISREGQQRQVVAAILRLLQKPGR